MLKGKLQCKNELFSKKKAVREGSILTTCLISLLVLLPIYILPKEEQKIEFRFPPSWTLFERRCLDQQFLVTSYCQSLAGLSFFCSLRHLVFVRSCTTIKVFKALIL